MRFMPQTATIVIPMEDPILHTEQHPLCYDGTCPCREDAENLNLLGDLIRAEVITVEGADVIMRGATI